MKIVVVVDMQNDFVTGPLGSPEAQAIVPVMVDRLKEYDDGNTLVLFTKDTHFNDYLETQEGQNLPIQHCIYMTDGWSICKDISSYVDHANFLHYSSGKIINSRILKDTFGSISLGELIKDASEKANVESITFMGVCTDICVVSNALLTKAFVPDIPVIVDASCCAGTTVEKHKAALETMKSCQIKVVNE